MHVQSWQAFSCNNSSSYHLVARFDGEAKAQVAAEKLTAFFEAHTAENHHGPLSLAMTEVAIEHDFEWMGDLDWASDWDGEYETIRVDLHGDRVLLYHSYCLGIGGIVPFVEALGGEGTDYSGEPRLAVFFHFQEGEAGQQEYQALSSYFSGGESSDTEKLAGPWGSRIGWGDRFWWSDGKSGGFFGPFEHEQVEELKQYLAGDGFADYRMILGSSELRDRIRTLSDCPLCPECDQPLGILEAGLSVPEDLATCMGCGGMFELPHLRANNKISRISETSVTHLVVQPESVIAMDAYGQLSRHSAGIWSPILPREGYGSTLWQTNEGTLLFAGRGRMLKRSDDQGQSFQEAGPQDLRLIGETPGGLLLAQTSLQRDLLRSDDGGATWQALYKTGRSPLTCLAAPSENLLYLAQQNGKLMRSRNGGKNWQRCRNKGQDTLRKFAVLRPEPVPSPDLHMIAVGERGCVLVSSDGEAWETRPSGTKADIRDLVQSGGRLYAVNSAGELMISEDEALTWEFRALTNDSLLCITEGASGVLWVGGNNGVVVQIDL